MDERNRADLDYLEFLFREEEYDRVHDILGNPFALEGRLAAGGKPGARIAALERLHAFASGHPSFKLFFELHLISHFLLFRASFSGRLRSWVVKKIDLSPHFQGMNREQVLSGSWVPVPVLVVHDEARLVYFMAGILAAAKKPVLFPEWAGPLMDKQCRAAVESAVSAAESVLSLPQGRHFFCYPLAVRNKSVQFKGSSLGLSLSLGFLSLSRGEPLPRDLAASGALTPPGSVKDAAALEKKVLLAEKRGMRVFLYPSLGPPPVKSTGMDLLPVNDLREAWMFARLYSPGRSQGLILLSEMLRDPDVFVNNMDLVEPEWLDWIGREGMAGQVISGVLDVPRRFSNFVDKIGWSLKNWKLEPARAMGSLVSPRAFAAAASSSALTALCFCTRNITIANHRGDVSTAAKWVREGELLLERALKADINACSDFLNNRFVACHNRYEFSPYLPPDLERIIECMEKRRAAQCEEGCIADTTLGELYGSLCQNFGFCGPGYLPACEIYAQKAMEAFGSGDVPEFKDEILRQHCYMAYARLDAGDHGRARAALFAYLEAEEWEEIRAKSETGDMSRWQHALLARFLADAPQGGPKKSYLKWAFRRRAQIMDHDHPWQLWLFNLGRMALDLSEGSKASALFQESLECCLSEHRGPTVRVMALMPLSGLLSLGEIMRPRLTGARKQILESAEILNPLYFRVLERKNFREVLRFVWMNTDKLFPFSYR